MQITRALGAHRPCRIKEERILTGTQGKGFRKGKERQTVGFCLCWVLMGARGTCQGLTAWMRFLSEKRRCVSLFHQCRIRLTTFPSLQKDMALGCFSGEPPRPQAVNCSPTGTARRLLATLAPAERPVAGVRVTSRGAPSPLPGGELTTDRWKSGWGTLSRVIITESPASENRPALRLSARFQNASFEPSSPAPHKTAGSIGVQGHEHPLSDAGCGEGGGEPQGRPPRADRG